ncbi:MAG TPA: hypothetical protein VGQ81_10425 [Acidobacteriota bacterium]|jgi:hypothetical protein|nr:hypothetical protein [Acidobacteriota bacterium]
MKKVCILIGIIFLLAALTGLAKEQTWSGKISDSMCGAKHMAGEHGGKKMSDRECTLACIKKGAKYVFVRGGKVFDIENQDFATLEEHAGHTVKLTGELQADKKTIKVSKIEMPAAKGGKKKKAA